MHMKVGRAKVHFNESYIHTNTYMHACMHTYIHTYKRVAYGDRDWIDYSYIHTYIHTYIDVLTIGWLMAIVTG